MNSNKKFNELFLNMKGEVAAIAAATSNQLLATQQSYLLVSEYCEQVRVSAEFESVESEIEFYKKVRSGFEAELIYLGEVYFILSTLPKCKKEAIRYLKKQFVPIRLYCRRYQWLYEYWTLGSSELDQQLFLRRLGEKPKTLIFSFPLPLGDIYAVPATKAFARFQAFQELQGFLEKQMALLENKSGHANSSIKWTTTKAALVELAYALKASGSVNNGNASIRDIANHLEQVFGQDLSQFYRTFQEIRIRKNSRTTFLDRLKEKLERWMDNTDLDGRGEG